MPRPSFIAALSISAVFCLAGCKTIYSDMYSSRRNYFKPEKETAQAPTELSAPSSFDSGAPAAPVPPAPGLDPAAAPPPVDAAAPAAPAPAAPPAIPGL